MDVDTIVAAYFDGCLSATEAFYRLRDLDVPTATACALLEDNDHLEGV